MPRVSVVIPAYNAERFLAQAVGSVLGQTYRDLEVIVIDDGSTDATSSVVDSYAGRIRYQRQANAGVSAARNAGFRLAAGEFVAFLDADDLWEPTKLERQIALLDTRPGNGLCFSAFHRVDGNLRVIQTVPAVDYPDFCQALLLHSCVVTMPTVVMRSELFAASGGFDVRLSQCADWDLWLRLSLRTTFVSLKEPLASYRTWPGNMSSSIRLLERDTFAVLDKFFAETETYRHLKARAYSNHWMILAGSYLHAGQLGSSLRCLKAGLIEHPRNLGRPLGLPARWLRRRLGGRTW